MGIKIAARDFDGLVFQNPFIFKRFLLSGDRVGDPFSQARDKERAGVMNPTEIGKIKVALIEAVDAVRVQGKVLFGNGEFMTFSVGHNNKGGQMSSGFQLTVDFERSLGGSESGPREHGQ